VPVAGCDLVGQKYGVFPIVQGWGAFFAKFFSDSPKKKWPENISGHF
jgi:hypothetical protein